MTDRRVVVTGLGTINPLGSDVEGVWKSLLAGESGIGTITSFDASHLTTTFAGEVRDFDPEQYIPKREARRLDRFDQFNWAAAGLAGSESARKTARGPAVSRRCSMVFLPCGL